MYQNIEIITAMIYSKCGVKSIDLFSYAKEFVHAPIAIVEFYESCKHCHYNRRDSYLG